MQFRKLADFLNGPWCPLLETNAMQSFVQIDGIFTGHHLVDGGSTLLLALAFGHPAPLKHEDVTPNHTFDTIKQKCLKFPEIYSANNSHCDLLKVHIKVKILIHMNNKDDRGFYNIFCKSLPAKRLDR